jgi:hypothetical protein
MEVSRKMIYMYDDDDKNDHDKDKDNECHHDYDVDDNVLETITLYIMILMNVFHVLN